MPPTIVCIDGNIGCGKSTVVNNLALDFLTFEEPIAKWSMLKYFYQDPENYALPFQIQILMKYYDLYQKIKNVKDIIVFERSPFSAKEIFIPVLLTEYPTCFGLHGLEVYSRLYDQIAFQPNYFIYLQVDDIATILQRVKTRDRLEEKGVKTEYLKQLNLQYEKVFLNKPNTFVVDAKADSAAVYSTVYNIIDKIRK